MNISPDQPITAVASPDVRSSAYSLPLTPRIHPSEIFLAMKSTAFIYSSSVTLVISTPWPSKITPIVSRISERTTIFPLFCGAKRSSSVRIPFGFFSTFQPNPPMMPCHVRVDSRLGSYEGEASESRMFTLFGMFAASNFCVYPKRIQRAAIQSVGVTTS